MKNQLTLGTSSVSFKNPVFIQSCASIVGQKEGEGPLGSCFDKVCEDPLFGTDTWEAAESTMQKETALLAIRKAGLQASDIRFLSPVTCSPRLLHLLSEQQILEFRFMVFSVHVPLWASLFPLALCV